MQNLTQRRRGLKTQIIGSFLFTVILILNIASWFFYSRTRDYFDNELGKTLIGLAKSGSELIDADFLEFLRPGYESGEFYKELRLNLEILQNNFSVNRLFIIDGSFKTLLDTKVDAPIGISPPHLKINLREVNAALSGKAVYSTLYRGYDENLYKSAYAPVFDKRDQPGRRCCVCGCKPRIPAGNRPH